MDSTSVDLIRLDDWRSKASLKGSKGHAPREIDINYMGYAQTTSIEHIHIYERWKIRSCMKNKSD